MQFIGPVGYSAHFSVFLYIFDFMKSIVITPKNQEELKFVSELLKKHGISSRILTEDQKEEIGMSILLNEADRKDLVPEEKIMEKLNS